MMGMLRTTRNPGASIGTRTIECRASELSSFRPVTPMTIASLHLGCCAPVVNHLRPLTT